MADEVLEGFLYVAIGQLQSLHPVVNRPRGIVDAG
jgi:hypothetical protein